MSAHYGALRHINIIYRVCRVGYLSNLHHEGQSEAVILYDNPGLVRIQTAGWRYSDDNVLSCLPNINLCAVA